MNRRRKIFFPRSAPARERQFCRHIRTPLIFSYIFRLRWAHCILHSLLLFLDLASPSPRVESPWLLSLRHRVISFRHRLSILSLLRWNLDYLEERLRCVSLFHRARSMLQHRLSWRGDLIFFSRCLFVLQPSLFLISHTAATAHSS